MAHDHDHDHQHHHDANTYYLEQLFTIGVCAALAFVTCLWWWKARQGGGQGLWLFIAERYHPLVLAGGLGLLALVVIRAAALWVSVDKTVAANGNGHDHHHDHDHDHAHDHPHTHEHAHGVTCAEGCGHSHAPPAHDHSEPAAHEHAHHHHDHGHGHEHGHDHGHEHGWAPWRYVVLALPVALYFLNLPNEVFGSKDLSGGLGGPAAAVADKGFAAEVGFKQLEAAALTPQTREEYTGKKVRLVGKFAGEDARRFTLARLKINCCSADAIPFNAVVMVDPNALAENSKLRQATERLKPKNKWVQVTGQVQFLSRPAPNDPGKLEYVPAVIVQPKPETHGEGLKDLIEVIPPPANPYVE